MALDDFLRMGFKKKDLDITGSRIFGLGGNEVRVCGIKTMDMGVNGRKYPVKFHIIENNTQSIIGLPSIVKMDLLERKNTSSKDINNIDCMDIFIKYKDLF